MKLDCKIKGKNSENLELNFENFKVSKYDVFVKKIECIIVRTFSIMF